MVPELLLSNSKDQKCYRQELEHTENVLAI